ncbi:MAG: PASTA domain-containing protein [Coriobacteriia bacterium]|nr:PASTA domain-containing protein [Coriobacteriia bacterium]
MKMRRIVVISIVACALLMTGCTAIGCGVAVPDVKGKTADQAGAALTAAGFELGKVTYDEAAEGALGAVVEQTPAAGTSSKEGAVVDVTVAGAAPVTVPSIVGLGRDAAAAALAAVGLTLGDTTTTYSTSVPSGAVIQQEPPAGTVVPHDAAVKAVVSKGPEPTKPPVTTVTHVKVPLVKGLKLATAKSKIVAAGLKWKHILGPGDGMLDVGFVYKQSPASGTSVDKGSVVSIYTWKGP